MDYIDKDQDIENNFNFTEESNIHNKEFIKSYNTNSRLYGLSFQNNKHTVRIATSTLETNSDNRLEILDYDSYTDKIKKVASEETEFPCSKIQWSPSRSPILASTSDILRLYKYDDINKTLSQISSLGKKQQGYTGPLTSMDWNKQNSSIIGVCSIDTTCTIWDINKNDIKTHLIAHDKEVYDIAFGKDENTFISTGADGSIRLFDLRALDTCSVLFETQDQNPFSRISWNINNSNFIAALVLDKNYIYIIDARVVNTPYAFLNYHTNVVNAVTWSPSSNAYICSVSDDKNALIWDIQLISNRTEDPLMSYTAENEIDNVSWSESNEEWIGITSMNSLQLLKVK